MYICMFDLEAAVTSLCSFWPKPDYSNLYAFSNVCPGIKNMERSLGIGEILKVSMEFGKMLKECLLSDPANSQTLQKD